MRQVQTKAGATGYMHQLDRVRRFLERVEGHHQTDVEFQDIVWSFFQHCWHLKDWVKHDPLATESQRENVCRKAYASPLLKICRDLCNGTKHLNLDQARSGSGARHAHVTTTIVPGRSSEMDCMVEDGHGNLISGKQLARACVEEWVRILESQRLVTYSGDVRSP
jgi:hypothetical protein